MRCKYCNHEIPQGMLQCEHCGQEVFIVPEYSPLEDMLAANVKDSFYSNESAPVSSSSAKRQSSANTGRTRGNTKNNVRGNTARTRDEREYRRRQAEKKRAAKRRRRRKMIAMVSFMIGILLAVGALVYFQSYPGIVRKGYKQIEKSYYAEAKETFSRAISKNQKRPEAYAGLAKVYVVQDDLTSAEDIFLNAISNQPKNADLYKACFQFYLDTEQPMGIPKLLADANDKVVKSLSEYVVEVPEFSLDSNQVYDDVQQVTLSSDEKTIYYSLNDEEVDTNSEKFDAPIQLSEGETVIHAIAVNQKGIPSETVTKTYTVQFPIEEAPAVSPSTGQYDYQTTIEIKVPDGYTAYYTMNGEDPTTASTPYTGPIDMPKGDTLFKAILVNAGGRVSGITTRNYIRD